MPFQPADIHRRRSAVPPAPYPREEEMRENFESSLDLNDYCISHPSSTFFIKAEGSGLEGDGIYSGDLLVIDRAVEPAHGRIALAVIEGEFALRHLAIKNGRTFLAPGSSDSEPLEITPRTDSTDASVWGIVIGVIRKI